MLPVVIFPSFRCASYTTMHRFTIFQNSPTYPPLLRNIEKEDIPTTLRGIGKPLDPKDTYFTIVGTRHPSTYGKQMAEKFAGELAAFGFVITSGLAYGIDAIAHETALEAGGKTIAVIGGGLKHISPTCNLNLAKRIQEKGSIITEYEDDMAPHKGTFPQRNRILAGMAVATLVIEAPEKSGALITAHYSQKYSHETFCLPANITQESSRGGNLLIQSSGAFPATSVTDILTQLGMSPSRGRTSQTSLPLLTDDEEKIYKLLSKSTLTFDELTAETRLPGSRVTATLSLLELKRLIKITGSHAAITR